MSRDENKVARIIEQFTGLEILGFLTDAEFETLYSRLVADGLIDDEDEENQ